jgi:hypothetical protein
MCAFGIERDPLQRVDAGPLIQKPRDCVAQRVFALRVGRSLKLLWGQRCPDCCDNPNQPRGFVQYVGGTEITCFNWDCSGGKVDRLATATRHSPKILTRGKSRLRSCNGSNGLCLLIKQGNDSSSRPAVGSSHRKRGLVVVSKALARGIAPRNSERAGSRKVRGCHWRSSIACPFGEAKASPALHQQWLRYSRRRNCACLGRRSASLGGRGPSQSERR